MKAKKGFSGLQSFTLFFSRNNQELMELPGDRGAMHRINSLFDEGNDEEARRLFRQALDETTRRLDRILEAEATAPADGDIDLDGDLQPT